MSEDDAYLSKAEGLVVGLTEVRAQQRADIVTAAKAELADLAEMCRRAGQSEKSYLISYRVTGRGSAILGSPDERRDDLIAVIEGFEPLDRHLATSTWIVRTPIASAASIVEIMRRILEEATDFLSVAEVTSNRQTIGNAALQS